MKKNARHLLPAIEWCAEYCRRQTNEEGVIRSDTDELEGRFPTGNANLCTSTLTFAGLRTASILESEIGSDKLAEEYKRRTDALEVAIEKYFGANIHGFNTYQYYKGCNVLRSWICMPLCVGITCRKEETVNALLSDYLLTADGLKTSEEKSTIWDRSTLYSLRGIFASGLTEKAMNELLKYSSVRLLGERVPYPVEAFPEGSKRHLSGESALYCKIFTDGILGLKPAGLRSFTVNPSLPTQIEHFYMRNIRAFGSEFDILLDRNSFRIVSENKTLVTAKYGNPIKIDL